MMRRCALAALVCFLARFTSCVVVSSEYVEDGMSMTSRVIGVMGAGDNFAMEERV